MTWIADDERLHTWIITTDPKVVDAAVRAWCQTHKRSPVLPLNVIGRVRRAHETPKPAAPGGRLVRFTRGCGARTFELLLSVAKAANAEPAKCPACGQSIADGGDPTDGGTYPAGTWP